MLDFLNQADEAIILMINSELVIIDIAVPADQFALGQLLDEYPEIVIELEWLVSLREGIIPRFWVDDATAEEIKATIEEDTFCSGS
ncbi:hypothetical protein [Halocatena marina]|nr:hypothetical protein [Halocatena marina]